MAEPLFDNRLKKLRHARAQRQGERLFLAERAVEDVAERLQFVNRRFRRGLVIGCPEELQEKLAGAADDVIFAPELPQICEVEPESVELLLVFGQFDTENELAATAHVLRSRMAADGLFAGVFPGNDSLPKLRAAMLAADQAAGAGFTPRVHPRIEAAAFTHLLAEAGFVEPIVDIDRVRLRYRRLDDLVADLRGMGATNVLAARSRRPLSRTALAAAREAFAAEGDESGTVETVELIHFAAWTRPENIRP